MTRSVSTGHFRRIGGGASDPDVGTASGAFSASAEAEEVEQALGEVLEDVAKCR
jgi:hypothetical protein